MEDDSINNLNQYIDNIKSTRSGEIIKRTTLIIVSTLSRVLDQGR